MKRALVAAVVLVVGASLVLFATRGDPDGPDGSLPARATAATTVAAAPAPVPSTEPATATSAAAGYEPRWEEASCAFEQPVGYSAECGFLLVPEDRTQPDGAQVRLHVAVFPASTDLPAPDPIVYLEGGPGQEILEFIDLVFEERFAVFLETRDVVIFDQRGTGFSEPSLACAAYRDLELDLLDEDLPVDEVTDRVRGVLDECRDGFLDDGIDLTQYNSATNAADVADLRTVLAADEVNLYGISYGTRLALTVMRDHPEGIRSVILDSVLPPEADMVADIAPNARRAFDVLFAGCVSTAACAAAFPDLEERFFALVDRLDDAPITVDVTDLFTGETYEAVIDGNGLVGIVFQALYSEAIIPTLPDLITQVDSGDYRDLGNLYSIFLATGEFFSVGMHTSVGCHEEVPYADMEAAVAAAGADPRMGRIVEGSLTQSPIAAEFCATWGAGLADPIESESVTSEIPALVLAGEYDPITPPAYGRQAAAHLDRATFVEFPGLGHAVSTAGECPLEITLTFLADPLSAVDVSCAALLGGPDFTIPGEVIEVGRLVPFEDGFAGVAGVVPENWEAVGFGTHARQSSGLDQTSIVQQAVPGGSRGLFLQLLAGLTGLDADAEPVEEREVGQRRWSLYVGEIQGFRADIGIADADGLTYFVLLVSDPDEATHLFEEVFLPALAAIQGA